ncbi:MAG TPA: hypothetical protein VF748_14755 [Candidatus Acidoferrum sp.]
MSGLFGGNTPTPPVQQAQTFPNTPQAAQSAFGDIGNLNQFSLGGATLPQILQLAQSTAGGVTGAPGQFALGTAGQVAPQLVNAGLGEISSSVGAMPYVQQILQTAFDPQNALYNRTLSDVTNQAGAAAANAGVASTPYGASTVGNTLSNFNIDWANQQLQRQATGLGSAIPALEGLGTTAAGGGELATMGGGLPFTTLAGLNQSGMGALTGAVGAGNEAAQVPQTAIGDWLSYLSGNNSAISQNNAANMAAAEFQAQQEQQQFQNIASAFGGLGSSLGGLFGAGGIFGKGLGGGAFSGVFA